MHPSTYSTLQCKYIQVPTQIMPGMPSRHRYKHTSDHHIHTHLVEVVRSELSGQTRVRSFRLHRAPVLPHQARWRSHLTHEPGSAFSMHASATLQSHRPKLGPRHAQGSFLLFDDTRANPPLPNCRPESDSLTLSHSLICSRNSASFLESATARDSKPPITSVSWQLELCKPGSLLTQAPSQKLLGNQLNCLYATTPY
jgi:hypothetical protein